MAFRSQPSPRIVQLEHWIPLFLEDPLFCCQLCLFHVVWFLCSLFFFPVRLPPLIICSYHPCFLIPSNAPLSNTWEGHSAIWVVVCMVSCLQSLMSPPRWHTPQSTTWPNILCIGFWLLSRSTLLFNTVESYCLARSLCLCLLCHGNLGHSLYSFCYWKYLQSSCSMGNVQGHKKKILWLLLFPRK